MVLLFEVTRLAELFPAPPLPYSRSGCHKPRNDKGGFARRAGSIAPRFRADEIGRLPGLDNGGRLSEIELRRMRPSCSFEAKIPFCGSRSDNNPRNSVLPVIRMNQLVVRSIRQVLMAKNYVDCLS